MLANDKAFLVKEKPYNGYTMETRINKGINPSRDAANTTERNIPAVDGTT